jgi:hypothetical protein
MQISAALLQSRAETREQWIPVKVISGRFPSPPEFRGIYLAYLEALLTETFLLFAFLRGSWR